MTKFDDRVKNLTTDLLEKWGTDARTSGLEEKIKKWLSPVNDEYEKHLFLKMLEHFSYHSRSSMYSHFTTLHKRFIDIESEYELSIYTSIKSKDGRVNSSQELLIYYRDLNELSHKAVFDDITPLFTKDEWNYIKNIVVVDDIIGSGKTVLTYIKSNKAQFIKKKLYILVIEVSDEAYNRIIEYGEENGIDISIQCINKYKKAFTEEYIFKDGEHTKAREILESREISLWNGRSNNVLGYEGTEALVAFVTNTPNNTLSSFWCESEHVNWYPLFPRRKDKIPRWKQNAISSVTRSKGAANYRLSKAKKSKDRV